ncbi:SH3 domain [Carpediemonas membranifera]|uniref:SH3 domain n=1 Tax=Carpediemonas membranifera TaxID=201153 RepID=A0A8J6AXH5_9EUKA|nr:SH3 domain [Carpediemonas membranifera]|eukprot:KAG9397276.1 SH3 domain [Carpediemonas membranifera]
MTEEAGLNTNEVAEMVEDIHEEKVSSPPSDDFNFREMLWDKFDVTDNRIIEGKKTVKVTAEFIGNAKMIMDKYTKDLTLMGKAFAKETIPDKKGTLEHAYDSLRDVPLSICGAMTKCSSVFHDQVETPLVQLKRRTKIEHERMRKEEENVSKNRKAALSAFKKAEAASRKAAEDADKAEDAFHIEHNNPGPQPATQAKLEDKCQRLHQARVKADETHRNKADEALRSQVSFEETMNGIFDRMQTLDSERLDTIKNMLGVISEGIISLGEDIIAAGQQLKSATEEIQPMKEIDAFVQENKTDAYAHKDEDHVVYVQQESGIEITPIVDQPVPVESMESVEAAAPAAAPAAVTGEMVVALFDWTAQDDTELTVVVGEELTEMEKIGDWSRCRNAHGTEGLVPGNYIEKPSAGTYATALYDFDATDDSMVSVTVGERVNVLSDDGDWTQARKENGQVGLVPTAYLEK